MKLVHEIDKIFEGEIPKGPDYYRKMAKGLHKPEGNPAWYGALIKGLDSAGVITSFSAKTGAMNFIPVSKTTAFASMSDMVKVSGGENQLLFKSLWPKGSELKVVGTRDTKKLVAFLNKEFDRS